MLQVELGQIRKMVSRVQTSSPLNLRGEVLSLKEVHISVLWGPGSVSLSDIVDMAAEKRKASTPLPAHGITDSN
jgi:hypothetical protein